MSTYQMHIYRPKAVNVRQRMIDDLILSVEPTSLFGTDLYVTDTVRPVMYLVNGSHIIRAEVPTPPHPFQGNTRPTPGPTAMP